MNKKMQSIIKGLISGKATCNLGEYSDSFAHILNSQGKEITNEHTEDLIDNLILVARDLQNQLADSNEALQRIYELEQAEGAEQAHE